MTTIYVNGEERDYSEIKAESKATWDAIKAQPNKLRLRDDKNEQIMRDLARYLPKNITNSKAFKEWKRRVESDRLMDSMIH